MVGTPSPRVIGDPVPTNKRKPDPSSVIIWPPHIMRNTGNPNMSVRPFVNPSSMKSQLFFVFIEFCG
jgi:hypothetical protein